MPGAGLPADNGAGAGRSSGSGGATHAPRKVVKAPVRVYNNSRIRDLAQQAAADFRDSGWSVTEVGNYPYGAIGTSTVYYEPGNARELAAAQSLASSFGMRAAPRFGGIANATPGLIVIITRDYQRR
ncbi:MAG TPA: LytR C-terminal domain-containing protein [Pseudonocardia sp.]|nr:LytR C-terminal domain-containing protein [Pseudonocardia sp.]